MYTEQLKSGANYGTLNKAIGIHILNFTSIVGADKYHNVFHITEKETGLPYFTDLELHTIELVKFSNDPQEDLESLLKKIKNALDIWTAFLTRHDLLDKDNLPKPLANSSLKKALHVLETMNFTDEENMAYEDRLKWLRIEANTVEKARREGQVEGKLKGIQIGQEKGKKEGKKERNIEIAKAMLLKGYPLSDIVFLTGLSASEVKGFV